jgi:hypothetical protein
MLWTLPDNCYTKHPFKIATGVDPPGDRSHHTVIAGYWLACLMAVGIGKIQILTAGDDGLPKAR